MTGAGEGAARVTFHRYPPGLEHLFPGPVTAAAQRLLQ